MPSPRVALLATASLIGEGYNLPLPNTFVTMALCLPIRAFILVGRCARRYEGGGKPADFPRELLLKKS